MRRGRKPKPTKLHVLHGTVRQRHATRGPDAPVPGPLEAPPPDLTAGEQAAWHQAIENAPAGILGSTDASLLRMWAVTETRYLAAKAMQNQLDEANKLPLLIKTRAGDLIASPYIGIMNKCTTLMLRMVEQLGFAPSARVGLGKAAKDPKHEGEDNRWLQLEALRRKAANNNG